MTVCEPQDVSHGTPDSQFVTYVYWARNDKQTHLVMGKQWCTVLQSGVSVVSVRFKLTDSSARRSSLLQGLTGAKHRLT